MQANVFKRLEIEIKRVNYAYTRYKAEATFAFLYHENELTPLDLGAFVRLTDKFVKVDEHTYFMIYAFTSQEDAFKASQNLLYNLDKSFNNVTTCIALSAFDISNSPHMIINKLTQILQETRKNSYGRIEDENILNLF